MPPRSPFSTQLGRPPWCLAKLGHVLPLDAGRRALGRGDALRAGVRGLHGWVHGPDSPWTSGSDWKTM